MKARWLILAALLAASAICGSPAAPAAYRGAREDRSPPWDFSRPWRCADASDACSLTSR